MEESTLMKYHKITGQKISQKDKEIGGFIQSMTDRLTKSYLEIGARQGNTFYDVMTSLPKGSLGVAVDLPGGTWGKSGTQLHLTKVCDILRTMGYEIHMYLGDSTSPEIINAVKSHGPYDAALIDGDHRYAGVKSDYDNYSPMVLTQIAFHDIDGHGVVQSSDPSLAVEVPILWEEIKKANPDSCREFIDKHDQPHRPMGIGIVYK